MLGLGIGGPLVMDPILVPVIAIDFLRRRHWIEKYQAATSTHHVDQPVEPPVAPTDDDEVVPAA
jgi:hypothetical protein